MRLLNMPNLLSFLKRAFVLSPLYSLVFLLSWFGLGAAPISILPFFNLPLIFFLVRTSPLDINFGLFGTIAIGATFAYKEPSNSPMDSNFDNFSVLLIIGSLISFFTLLPMILAKFFIKYTNRRSVLFRRYYTLRLFVFPVIWTFTWSSFRRWFPIISLGSWGDWAYTIGNAGYAGDPIMQIASIGGLSAINFILAFISQIVVDYLVYRHGMKYIHGRVGNLIDGDEEAPLLASNINLNQNVLVEKLFSQNFKLRFVLLFGTLALVIWGSSRLYDIEDNSDPIKTMKIGCVLPTRDATIESMIKQSAILATQSSKIVLWGESALDLRPNELEKLLEYAGNETKRHNYFLGLTYFLPSERRSDKKKNMFTLIGPDGKKIFDYQKTHPVPLAESRTVESGPGGQLPIAKIILPKLPKLPKSYQTEEHSLNVSAAICLDMDFPELITTASAANLILQPSQTWSSHIGLQHLRMASVRAIENGFWVLRCDGAGASGLIDPLGRIRNVQISPKADRFQLLSWDLPLTEEKIQTIYASWGEYTVWGSLIALVALRLSWAGMWQAAPEFMENKWNQGAEKLIDAKAWAERRYDETFKHVEREEDLNANDS